MTAPTTALTFLQVAERALAAFGEPRTAEQLTHWGLQQQLLVTSGKTPAATMEAQLVTSVKHQGDASPFVRVAPRTYGLRRWVAEGRIAAPAATGGGEDVRIVFYPDYASVRIVLPVLAGMTRAQVTGLRAAMGEHRGTTDDNADWTDPDSWIPERLTGEHRDAALRVWTGTKKRVNPRHMQGQWLLASGYDLLVDGADGRLVIGPRGRDFLDQPSGAVVREIDEHEGLLQLLALLAEQGPAAPAVLLAPWMDHLRQVSRVRAESTARSFLYYRLRNLVERQFAERVGQGYALTAAGLAWLQASGFAETKTVAPDETRQLWDLVAAQRSAVRAALRERLAAMDAYAFEHLVARLLETMDYQDVQVTVRSGDKGVDVIGRIALGITEVREVIQVKRHRNNLHRPVLDMLRGSLHRFGAVKGTIITLGGFAKGARDAAFEPGAAPITLIDGEKLLDLLIEHGIGVRTRTVELHELDEGELTPAVDGAGSPEG